MAGKQGQRSWGYLRRLPSGRWQASYVGPDEQRHAAPVTFSAKIDAEAWLAGERRVVEGDPEGWRPPKARLAADLAERERAKAHEFGAYAADWVKHRGLTPRTEYQYQYYLDRHIIPTFGAVALTDITRATVREWHKRVAPKSPSTRANAYRVLHAILATAVDDELIETNPAKVRNAATATRAREIEPATPQVLQALADASPRHYAAMVLLAGFCALRLGELAELRRSDVDMRAGVIRVRRATAFVPGVGQIVKEPKTKAGRRDVAIPSHLAPVVAAHLLEHTGPGPDALLFPAPRGGQLKPGSMRWWREAREAAGVSQMRFHDLRHSGAVLAAQAGATTRELMHRLGHATATTALIYQHATAQRDRDLADRISAIAESR